MESVALVGGNKIKPDDIKINYRGKISWSTGCQDSQARSLEAGKQQRSEPRDGEDKPGQGGGDGPADRDKEDMLDVQLEASGRRSERN